MEKKLMSSDLDKKLILFYQPIVQCGTNGLSIYKHEVLVRFENDGKIESPNIFIEPARNCGLYHDITRVVFCKTIDALIKNPTLHLSFNFCYSDIENNETKTFVLKKLASIKKSICERLTFEILETKKFKDKYLIGDFLKEIRSYGSKIAIDDFGTEYANYDNLLNIEFDYVKIAGELIKDITKKKKNFNVVKSLMGLCKELEIKVVAEYVENQKIMDALCQLKCKYMQGYLFGRPAIKPIGAVENLLWEQTHEMV